MVQLHDIQGRPISEYWISLVESLKQLIYTLEMSNNRQNEWLMNGVHQIDIEEIRISWRKFRRSVA